MPWYSVRSRCSGLALIAVAVAGCAGGARKPVRITDHRAYLLSEVPEQFDVDALAGRHIVIDPGHGGPWPGAVGPNGVREADVNLGVGLHLWGLLREAGAHVELTRTTDRAVSDLPAPTLKQDLQARAEFTTARNPDVFLSLHHNADIIPGSRKNDLETYYQLRGGAPSLDLAQALHRHLARNLGERANAVRPGNFHVLRETPVPAVLGESSYISSADNAEHLAFAAMQRLEAEAYFLGLVEYFSRGVPAVHTVYPASGARLAGLTSVRATFALDRGVPLDPATIAFRLNGVPLAVRYDAEHRTAHAPADGPLPSGSYALRVEGRNVRGNAARPRVSTFTIDAPVHALHVAAVPPSLHPEAGGRAIISARVLDARGYPVLDGTVVRFDAAQGHLDRQEARTAAGVAVALWEAGASGGGGTVTARCGTLTASRAVPVTDTAQRLRVLRVARADTGAAVAGASVQVGLESLVSNRAGMVAVPEGAGSRYSVTAPGYWPAAVPIQSAGDRTQPVALLRPVARGVLQGQVIAIDAADGGAASGAHGPTGLRAADINLRVARYLADYLASAGATPVLTRAGDETTSPFRRVETSEAAAATRFVSIRHGATGQPERVLNETGHATTVDPSSGLVVEHYPTSAAGARLARLVREMLEEALPGSRGRVVQSVAYELTHTGSPAVRVQPLAPVAPAAEILLSTPGTQRSIAYAIFRALAVDFGADSAAFGAVAGQVEDAAGAPAAGVAVTVNGLWLAMTNREGRFVFDLLPLDEADLEVIGRGGTVLRRRVSLEAGRRARVTIALPAADG